MARPTAQPLAPSTPAFPSYTSGHQMFGATHAAILRQFFGRDWLKHSVTSDDGVPGQVRTFNNFTAPALENGRSRIYLGIHYQFDCDVAYIGGTQIGNLVYRQACRPTNPADTNSDGELNWKDWVNFQIAYVGNFANADINRDGKASPIDWVLFAAAFKKGSRRSLETFGVVEPIVWNRRTGHVVGGYRRLEVLRHLGHTHADVVTVDLTLAREKALNLALNKITGSWDDAKLAAVQGHQQRRGGPVDIELLPPEAQSSENDTGLGRAREPVAHFAAYCRETKSLREPASQIAPSLAEDSQLPRRCPKAHWARGLQAERGGFSRATVLQLLETLQIQLNSLSDAELDRFCTLLVVHGFLPS